MITRIAKLAAETAGDAFEQQLQHDIEDAKKQGRAALTLGSLLGGGYAARNALTSGDLTGRETLYHGTSPDKVKSIIEKGILPTTPENAVNTSGLAADPKRYQAALGKAYTEPNRLNAAMYAAQTEMGGINEARFRPSELSVKTLRNYLTGRGIAKANVPTWKMTNMVENPEIAGIPREKWIKDNWGLLVPEKVRGKVYDALAATRVFDGGLEGKYFPGNADYVRNSPKEILDYIRHNPKRFAKGNAKLLAGLGLLGAGGYGLRRMVESDD